MKRLNFSFGLLAGIILSSVQLPAQDYINLSKNLLKAMKNDSDAKPYVQQIARADPERLAEQIDTDRERLTFWINLYNGLIQYKLSNNPDYYEDRDDFFGDEILTVAGDKVSFDNLEHGVLRQGTSKLSMGYFSNPFGGDWHEPYEVDEIDWRIHFALNCGAASCPPVRIYDDETIYKQLNESTDQYLERVVTYDEEEETVYTSKLMSWFRGDFGGTDGAREIMHERGFIPSADVGIEFKEYDWTMKIGRSVFYDD